MVLLDIAGLWAHKDILVHPVLLAHRDRWEAAVADMKARKETRETLVFRARVELLVTDY